MSRPSSRKYEKIELLPIWQEDGRRYEVSTAPSIVLPTLSEREEEFFSVVESGDAEKAKRFLDENKDFHINCLNYQGLSALHMAVRSRSPAMVELLLEQKDVLVGDAALHAVRDNLPAVAAAILRHLDQQAPGAEFGGYLDSSEFPDHVTPLMLAAMCGHYETVDMLLRRRHTLNRPHPPTCLEEIKEEDSPETASARIDAYRAISNPAFLCQATHDPILAAFELYNELMECSNVHLAYHAVYKELALGCRSLAVDLIGQCRTSEEVRTVLMQRKGSDYPGMFEFPRLMLAMSYNQKEFVAHHNTQQILLAAWIGGWHGWKIRPVPLKILTVISRVVLLPAITAVYVVAPFSTLGQFWRLAVNKMINSIAAYLVFLALLIVQSYTDNDHRRKEPFHYGLEIVIVVFVAGYVWNLARICLLLGVRHFLHHLNNWYDMATQLCFAVTFLFWLRVWQEASARPEVAAVERKFWNWLDPALVAEGFFAVGTIMAFGRLLLLCQHSYYLGPLQVSFGKMGKDVAKYAVILALIIISFTAGLGKLYHYYDGMVQVDPGTGEKVTQASSFVSFLDSVKTLFWALFCMSPLESTDVIIENLPDGAHGTTINKHAFTQAVGHLAFAMFHVISVVLVLNMLVSSTTNTLQKVIDNVDIEWTYSLTEMQLNYLAQSTLPPPLNLIPTRSGVRFVTEWYRHLVVPGEDNQSTWSLMYCCYKDHVHEKCAHQNFPIVMSQLVQRYFREKEKNSEENDQDSQLNNLRQELLECKKLVRSLTEEKK